MRPARRRLVRRLSALAVLVGGVLLGYVVYEVWITDVISEHVTDQVRDDLRDQWAHPAPGPPAPPELGNAFALLHIPRFGRDFARPVVEGTDPDELEEGVGHYPHTALPGQQGNFAVAGHRVGRGSPFLDLDTMRAGDPVVVETADTWFVYRVTAVAIVRPTDLTVVAPTPGGPPDGAATGAYLTMTTCNPKFSSRERLVVHALLESSVSRAEAPTGPAALTG